MPNFNWPLMQNNIDKLDIAAAISFLQDGDDPILTQSKNVRAFEQAWSNWLGVKYSVFVNSGASANLITIAALKELYGDGEIIVPTLTWVSDIAACIQAGFTPVFVDINPHTLGMNVDDVLQKINKNTRAIFITHVLGLNALDSRLIESAQKNNILIIEDVCESHGATFNGNRLGSLGFASNFSFYYAHHMSTVEGGMVCTNNDEFYQIIRLMRSHGMVREATSDSFKARFLAENPTLNPEFIFAFPAFNVRNTEINAVIGLSQLSRLDMNNEKRQYNFSLFLSKLDKEKYFTEFSLEGQCNYALILILREKNPVLFEKVVTTLRLLGVEFRRGTAGGGNQLRQPYLKSRYGLNPESYPHVDHVHFYGLYIGNYPSLAEQKIIALCQALNAL